MVSELLRRFIFEFHLTREPPVRLPSDSPTGEYSEAHRLLWTCSMFITFEYTGPDYKVKMTPTEDQKRDNKRGQGNIIPNRPPN